MRKRRKRKGGGRGVHSPYESAATQIRRVHLKSRAPDMVEIPVAGREPHVFRACWRAADQRLGRSADAPRDMKGEGAEVWSPRGGGKFTALRLETGRNHRAPGRDRPQNSLIIPAERTRHPRTGVGMTRVLAPAALACSPRTTSPAQTSGKNPRLRFQIRKPKSVRKSWRRCSREKGPGKREGPPGGYAPFRRSWHGLLPVGWRNRFRAKTQLNVIKMCLILQVPVVHLPRREATLSGGTWLLESVEQEREGHPLYASYSGSVCGV
ncbi:unnamed protein product [Pleuronectes platessa]|uniref:Uncharacterized protein n=1 Tax=Pleuronectes platessa TaxID=8262 RepID=A0A9N7TV53_PLEPL|nr:unnamed protein product [Pleuronectes platessa]